MAELLVTQGDITTLDVDAIVNAANSALIPGGGVDGAIHRAAGPGLARATAQIGGCPTGDAVATDAFDLRARWVIHTVGPVWHGGRSGEPEHLASCYRRSLEVATEVGARSIAFPAISTGIYGYPLEPATQIAVTTVRSTLGRSPDQRSPDPEGLPTTSTVEVVHFVCFDEATRRICEAELGNSE